MPQLRRALGEYLADWRSDLPAAWRRVLADVEPALAAVRANLQLRAKEIIFPGRRGHEIAGTPAGSHVFRALDRIAPCDVRVIVVGQDPYPLRKQATGRAFEQGDLTVWPANPGAPLSPSLARIVQCVAAARSGDDGYVAGDAEWKRLHRDRAALRLQSPGKIFDHWQRQGVLFLNAGLTLSRFVKGGGPEQRFGHIPLWRPVVQAIFQRLAARKQGQLVFALWGAPARNVFARSGVRAAAVEAGTWGARVDLVEHVHPNARSKSGAPGFFRAPNPFVAINDTLRAMGAAPIDW